ncbi:carbamoyltransferase C-terminal domain-containing protein [Psychrosphaera algicola]|uniref:Carbamoyltransferase C-terminal domain-containing protein n=1 Tax=Psychrosphaera algicola TaxID=3023714 RepID=A0ABT5FBF2_9GAMM|nr:carbamoyltransferase C-terminal domain-containing protein [Psychrosphaera sp. G1-22]MDC2888865.1 carbamoyltransferase C-terminal domain-containing protein [Psychrosphaera sp. G1-22]
MFGSYLGPSYSNEQIKAEVENQKLVANSISNEFLYDHVAKLVEQGNVIGWFQGRMEFGPRALGNRSIIGDPRNVAMQSTMNLKIKYRESFRPFAPAVLATDVAKYFDHDVESPYMLFVANIKSELKLKTDNALFGIDKLNQKRSTLPAITHVDYSARIQTVHEDTNPEFHNLLSSFKAKTGCGVLVNTSFNVRGEPPVCSPKDAIRCFLATEMDYLVMNNFVLAKTDQPQSAIDVAKSIKFDMD